MNAKKTTRRAPKVAPFTVVKAEFLWGEVSGDWEAMSFSDVKSLDRYMSQAYHYGHKGEGYCKMAFRLTFANGETYEGRNDASGSVKPTAAHMWDFLNFASGRKCPPQYTESDYRNSVFAKKFEEFETVLSGLEAAGFFA